MSMNELTTLEAQDTFHQTICKLKAMADMLPRALEDGEELLRGAESGVGYILEDIAKEMEQFSDEYWALRSGKLNDGQKKLQNLADDLTMKLTEKNGVAA